MRMTPVQSEILKVLKQYGPMNRAAIAAQMNRLPSEIWKSMQGLIAAGKIAPNKAGIYHLLE
ncbi:MAG: hypothetical protein NVSMB70_02150 [Chamaesiphon sp.]